jgi:hypothetical protein
VLHSSTVFAGITIAAFSGAAGWIGGVMVTRAQVVALVEQLPPQGDVPGRVPIDLAVVGEEAARPADCSLTRHATGAGGGETGAGLSPRSSRTTLSAGCRMQAR